MELIRRKIPIGKKVGSAIYVHRYYAYDIVPKKIMEEAELIGMSNYFNWDVVKWDKRKGTVTFVYCPGFDRESEPEIEGVITVNVKNRTRRIRKYDNNPLVYHHKWLMVADDYHGFSVYKAKMRSIATEETIYKHRIDKKRIGSKKYWEEVVVPLIK
jgi:hypothetical protein